MNFNQCPLYSLKSKKTLMVLLEIKNKNFLKQDYIVKQVFPRIDNLPKGRLIEAPSRELKRIQTKIKNFLNCLEFPQIVFSGVKKRSYVDNAKMHLGTGTRRLYKIDLTAFFPTISRNTVYDFFTKDLNCSPDVASILTNLTTIDLKKCTGTDLQPIYEFLDKKGVACYNHLISGSPCSQVLSYLVNRPMFNELEDYAKSNNATMTIYVDDVTFSSESRLSSVFKEKVISITEKYGYKISEKKVKYYTKSYPKLITGVIIGKDGKPTLRNSIRHNILLEFKQLQLNPEDEQCRKRLRGLLTAARQIDQNAFPRIYKFAFSKNMK